MANIHSEPVTLNGQMTRYKGRATAKSVERDFPHFVDMFVPDGGLGRRLDTMYEWHRTRARHSPVASARRNSGDVPNQVAAPSVRPDRSLRFFYCDRSTVFYPWIGVDCSRHLSGRCSNVRFGSSEKQKGRLRGGLSENAISGAGVNCGPPLRLSDFLIGGHRGRRTATLILLSQNVFVGPLRNIGTGSIISPAERSHSIVSLTERTASMRFIFATNYSVAKVNTELRRKCIHPQMRARARPLYLRS